MAKQIKVIKCPQCGNTKPQPIGNEHYRCDKCGAEFFLDNDDVNINVNHSYGPTKSVSSNSSQKGFWVVIIVVCLILVVLIPKFCVDQVRNISRETMVNQIPAVKKTERKQYLFSMLLDTNMQGVSFVLVNRNKSTYAVFRNVATGELIKEQELAVPVIREQPVVHRWFVSDSTDYIIVNNNLIYKINRNEYTFTDATAEICARKPALNAGLMSVSFVPAEHGEGFCINTNLGKELYYFSVADALYTRKAFEFMTKDNTKGLLSGAKNRVYYLFLNKESAHSSNVAQLMEITYKFNNGGPENKMMKITGSGIRNLDEHRIVSCKPITDERIYFSPEVLFSDQWYILIAYQPTLAQDAGTNLQLLNKAGDILWTTPFKNKMESLYTVRIGSGFMVQIAENNFIGINIGGKNVQSYQLP